MRVRFQEPDDSSLGHLHLRREWIEEMRELRSHLVRAEKRSVEPREEAPQSMAGSTEVEGNEADNCSEPPASESKPKSKFQNQS